MWHVETMMYDGLSTRRVDYLGVEGREVKARVSRCDCRRSVL